MITLAASTAVLDIERLFPQHQAALTLLQRYLADPGITRLRWLDLACGKGQILVQLDDNLSASERAKIAYFGYDLNVEFGRLTEKRTTQLSFQEAKVGVGELARFPLALDNDMKFDFITLTNTIHEIDPSNLSAILFDCIDYLADSGSVFIYDMETLPSPELGAIPWRATEIGAIIGGLLRSVGVTQYTPAVGRWVHRTVSGWNTQIEKRHIIKEAMSFHDHRELAVAAARDKIVEILKRRLVECELALQSLAKFGSATGSEGAEEVAFLYEFWALQRALGLTS